MSSNIVDIFVNVFLSCTRLYFCRTRTIFIFTFTVRVTVSPTTSLSISPLTKMTPVLPEISNRPGGVDSVKFSDGKM